MLKERIDEQRIKYTLEVNSIAFTAISIEGFGSPNGPSRVINIDRATPLQQVEVIYILRVHLDAFVKSPDRPKECIVLFPDQLFQIFLRLLSIRTSPVRFEWKALTTHSKSARHTQRNLPNVFRRRISRASHTQRSQLEL